jgi:hypothetical protein
MEVGLHNCQSESVSAQVAAYLDGQLEITAASQFEEHIKACRPCSAELNAQRQFLCELDSVLSSPEELPIPKDFARVVSARAESDMRGVRTEGEGRRALLACLALGITAFALLGVTASESVLISVRLLGNKVMDIVTLLWSTLHDAFIGLMIVSRVVVQVFQPHSMITSLIALIALAFGLVSLSHLIVSYHRRRQTRLFE